MGELDAVSVRSAVARATMADRIEDYEAACLTGTQSDLHEAALGFHLAAAGLAGALLNQAEEILKFWGIDPATRP